MASIEKRIAKDGGVNYRVKVRLKGFPGQDASFKRLTDAKRWAQSTEAAIREGRHFKTTEAKRRTFGEMTDRYIRDVLPHKKKMQQSRTMHLNWWKSELGKYALADVSPSMIAELRDKLLKEPTPRGEKRSPSTVVRYMASLSHTYTICVKEWGWIDDSPMRKVTKPKEPRGRVRFLSDDERENLLKSCKESSSSYIYTIVVLALSTGMRHGEIINLTWNDIDFERSRIVLHETKNNERRGVHISAHALECLKNLSKVRRIDTNLLFPSNKIAKLGEATRPIDFRKPWLAVLAKANIEDFRFHDLRHSCASYLAMNGASLAEIAEVLGHKTLQMVKRYSHISETHTSKVLARMNEKIFGISG